MTNKLNFLMTYSLNRKLKSKWFIIVNLILTLGIIIIFNIDYFINLWGGDFQPIHKIIIVTDLDIYHQFKTELTSQLKTLPMRSKVEIKKENHAKLDILLAKIKADEVIVNLTSDIEWSLKGQIYTLKPLGTLLQQVLKKSATVVKNDLIMTQSALTSNQIEALMTDVKWENHVIETQSISNSAVQEINAPILVITFIVPLFSFITIAVQMIGAEINDEKASHSLEIILSSVPAQVHFWAKLGATLKYVLYQGVFLFLDGFGALIIRLFLTKIQPISSVIGIESQSSSTFYSFIKSTGLVHRLMIGLPVILILIGIAFLIYGVMAAVLSALTTNSEEFQQFQLPLMIILMFGVILATMAASFPGSNFINLMACIPLFSFVLAPTIYLLGYIGIKTLIIITLVNLLFSIGIYKLGLKIYQKRVLNYETPNLLKWFKVRFSK